MRRLSIWKQDWFVAIVLVIVYIIFSSQTAFISSLERKMYDWGVQSSSRTASDKIAIIAIDDQSIANLGRWPWPRDIQAKLIDKLSQSNPKVIGNTVFFSEPQIDAGVKYLSELKNLYVEKSQAQVEASEEVNPTPEVDPIIAKFDEALTKLDTDQILSQSFAKASNVVMPMLFSMGEPQGRPDVELPNYIVKQGLELQAAEDMPLPAFEVLLPLPKFAEKALALGALNSIQDVDGAIRVEPLLIQYYDQSFPSFSLMVAAKSLNLNVKDIRVVPGESVQLANLKIGTDANSNMLTYFYQDRDQAVFQVDSFYDVFSGKLSADKYRGKIVLIGATAKGVGQTFPTPVSEATSPVVLMAHTISSILQQHFFKQPTWAGWVVMLINLLVAAYLIAILPKLKAGMAAILTLTVFTTLLTVEWSLMVVQLTWVPLVSAASLLLFGHLVLTTKRFLVTEKGKEKSETESAESNRMLGLAFQGQGQLDMAFDKFRKCPMDNSIMELLYNLALDFERKRQFNKAETVYQYMAEFNPKFKDLEQKLNRAKAMAETVILGGSSGRGNASTLILENGSVEKPMLGRYQVEKELGKGAMGVVYYGKDPKISRFVAIKTMALSQEFEADELEEARSRFFREAETAGRLNHPNIVTIYDAGEEHDLAYIAMEFLKGKDLLAFTKPNALLPLSDVLKIVREVAEALHYAHEQNVVHRDIKPANIMYEPEAKLVKVTDFGIARITDASKTKTGMVLGTPSYMSPEQLSGKKIDGRSDLFSLGVMLYQMTTGQLLFVGESMAELMFRIANEPHRMIREIKPDLPLILEAIINKALAKQAEKRFLTGKDFANAIRKCEQQLLAQGG